MFILLSSGCLALKKWIGFHLESKNLRYFHGVCRDLKENMRKMETRSDFRCRSAAVEDRKLQLKEEAEAADLDSE